MQGGWPGAVVQPTRYFLRSSPQIASQLERGGWDIGGKFIFAVDAGRREESCNFRVLARLLE
jgi:hypothetical protein